MILRFRVGASLRSVGDICFDGTKCYDPRDPTSLVLPDKWMDESVKIIRHSAIPQLYAETTVSRECRLQWHRKYLFNMLLTHNETLGKSLKRRASDDKIQS